MFAAPPQPPYLSSWQDSTFKAILLDFISRVTNPALDSYVPRDQRIACFDNDGSEGRNANNARHELLKKTKKNTHTHEQKASFEGTVWTEQPMLPQTAFLLWFVKRFPDPGQVSTKRTDMEQMLMSKNAIDIWCVGYFFLLILFIRLILVSCK